MQWKRGRLNKAHRYVVYPLFDPQPYLSTFERCMVRLKSGFIGRCTVCGAARPMRVQHENLRETCICFRCQSMNRQRQIAYVICQSLSIELQQPIAHLSQLASRADLDIYNTEARGALHQALCAARGYACSEFFGEEYLSGQFVGSIMHQDLMNLSFVSESIDLVISSDVFEHIPDPYKAHTEIFRILRRGGRHVFTVPYYQTQFLDELRAEIDESGTIQHVKEPIYHEDPLRDGALVYRIFSLEMLCRLQEIGFKTHMYHIYRPWNGIFGPNGIVFESIKE